MDITKSSRGGDMLIYQGYSYVKKKTKNGSIRWACSKSRFECQGVITTEEVPIANPHNFRAHNHNASNGRVEAMKCRSDLKDTSQRNNAAGTSALVTVLQTLSPDAMAEIGAVDAIKRDVQRQNARHRPAEPNSLAVINLQQPWTTTGGQHQVPFLFHVHWTPRSRKNVAVCYR